ncbi:MAG: 16S rRNA (cytosine(1402)-N(4))-methyltransferase RsmH [Acidobacteria bacterium]|nr:16S rRNA (cytosine(1402)-N(4))-methyltransferase RsmH [Acidobacteriota bacterium]MBI3657793.1 16S rRNA (cytosine(1402)-N(4))-methyltransferase RsmH [Acidobacteriota bacterium]
MITVYCLFSPNESGLSPEPSHVPVLVDQVIDFLGCRLGSVVVDGTVGMGGHAEKILEQIGPSGRLIGVDRDSESLTLSRKRLEIYSNCKLYADNFKNLPLILNNLGQTPVDGILLDLGVSSYQLLHSNRGFSFQIEAPLDMRMDREQKLTAATLVNHLSEAELSEIFFKYGEEPRSRKIAKAIVRERAHTPITKTTQLSALVEKIVPRGRQSRIHPATQVFQALRIATNDELTGLEATILSLVDYLKPGGRLVVISFQSLEDRIIKRAFRRLSGRCVCSMPPELCRCEKKSQVMILTRKPLRPSMDEVRANPRARSAILRACEKKSTVPAD